MDVILRQDVEKLGSRGEVVSVADGYGRNYLIPGGLAWVATARAKQTLEEERSTLERKHARERSAAEELAGKIEAASCTISMRVGADDKLYGAVTSQHISDSLRESGLEIDRRKIDLEEPIKDLGVFRIPIKIHPDVTATVKVWIVRE